jgi:hypothetical protein
LARKKLDPSDIKIEITIADDYSESAHIIYQVVQILLAVSDKSISTD